MAIWKISVAIIFHVMFHSTSSVPIVPLSLTFGKVLRPPYDDSNASIGPGLGGSPILVDTRHHTTKE